MGLREQLYFTLFSLRGQPLGATYRRYLREYQDGIPAGTTQSQLRRLLDHCLRCVPYYADSIRTLGEDYHRDPIGYLDQFPILTKDILRNRFDDLKSSDLQRRRWYFNTSGGSTGEPVRFIQDWEYAVGSGATTLLYSKLIGRRIGEYQALLWGSERDILQGSDRWKARLIQRIDHIVYLNAYQMTPERMREFLTSLNRKRPKLLVAYAEALYELARFAAYERLPVLPQAAIITSATTLYPHMRKLIEQVFQCRVYNRYGSREVGDVACELPGCKSLWVAPWANYVEVVDERGIRVPDGEEGDILVTSLTNYAMPLIRYRIEDFGVLAPAGSEDGAPTGQTLQVVLGKSVDLFRTKEGTRIEPGFFESILYFRDWIQKFQVIQKSHSRILFRLVESGFPRGDGELDEIAAKTKKIMGEDCEVLFEFVDEIPASRSGKHRYQVSEVR